MNCELMISCFFLLVVLYGVLGDDNCLYSLPSCTDSINENDLLEFVIPVSSVDTSRICITSNNTEYGDSEFYLLIHTDDSMEGVYCADKLFDSNVLCATNDSALYPTETVVFYKVTDETNTVNFNFFADDDLIVSFNLVYAPQGIYPLPSNTTVTVTAGSNVTLQWISYDIVNLVYTYINEYGEPRPGMMNSYVWSQCLPSPNASLPNLTDVVIESVAIEQAGVFVLSGDINGFNIESTIQLTVEPSPNPPVLLYNSNPPTQYEIGTNAKIHCEIEGTLQSPSWYFNNVPIINGTEGYIINGSSLMIYNVALQDGGLYTCTASNQYGITMKDFKFIPFERPDIQVFLPVPVNDDYIVRAGTTVIIPCFATGIPTPRIRWFNGTDELSDGAGNGRISIEPVSGALVIKDFTQDDRSSTGFRCSATTLNDPVESQFHTVVLTSEMLPDDNSILEPLYTISSTGSVQLSCYSGDIDNITIEWFKDAELLPNSSPNLTVTGTNDGSTWGHYCCRISRKMTNAVLDTRCTVVTVRLSGTLDLSLMNTAITTEQSLFFIVISSTTNNIDPPIMNWYRNGAIYNTSDSRISVFQNAFGLTTLEIKKLTTNDSGVYEVIGTNYVSSVRTMAEVLVVERCSQNNLSSPDAEGNIDTVRGDWSINSNDDTTVIIEEPSERYFALTPNSTKRFPHIQQNITISEEGKYDIYFSGRMRAPTPENLLPLIRIVSPNSVSTNISIPYEETNSWQWVSQELTLNITESSVVQVSMEIVEVDPNNTSSVFFDDLCLSVNRTSNDQPTSTTTSTSTSTENLIFDLPLVAVIGGGAGVVILLVTFICLIVMGCCFYCYRKRQRSKRDTIITELSRVFKDRNNTIGDSVALTRINKHDTEHHDEELRPVYVTPGETPTYLDSNFNPNTIETRNENRNRINSDSYEYARTTTVNNLPSSLPTHSPPPLSQPPSIVEELYDDVNEDRSRSHTHTSSTNLGVPLRITSQSLPPPPNDTIEIYEIPSNEPSPNLGVQNRISSLGRQPLLQNTEEIYEIPSNPPSPRVSISRFDSATSSPPPPLPPHSPRVSTSRFESVTSSPLPPIPPLENSEAMYDDPNRELSPNQPKDANGYLSISPDKIGRDSVYTSLNPVLKDDTHLYSSTSPVPTKEDLVTYETTSEFSPYEDVLSDRDRLTSLNKNDEENLYI